MCCSYSLIVTVFPVHRVSQTLACALIFIMTHHRHHPAPDAQQKCFPGTVNTLYFMWTMHL